MLRAVLCPLKATALEGKDKGKGETPLAHFFASLGFSEGTKSQERAERIRRPVRKVYRVSDQLYYSRRSGREGRRKRTVGKRTRRNSKRDRTRARKHNPRAAHTTEEDSKDCEDTVVARADEAAREELGVVDEVDPDGGEDDGGTEVGCAEGGSTCVGEGNREGGRGSALLMRCWR